MAKLAVIVWDENYRVAGIAASAGRGGGDFSRPVKVVSNAAAFSAGLAEVWGELDVRGAEAILLTGFMPESVCFELPLPPVGYAQLNGLLQFELPRRLPCPPAELSVCFRRTGTSKVRVFAIKTRQWEKLLAAVREAGIRCDAVVHPFMTAAEPFAYFPQYVPGVCFRLDETSGTMEMALPEPDAAAGDLPETALKFAAGTDWRKAGRYLSPLPGDLKPQRFRMLKAALIVLTVLCVGFGLALGGRSLLERRTREAAVGQALDGFDAAMARQSRTMPERESLNALATGMLEATDEIDPLSCIAVLTAALPENAWIINFRCGGGSVMLTLLVNGPSGPPTAKLNALSDFEVDSMRQQLNPDGAVTMYVTLKPRGGRL